jgi:hypothetical protein
MNFAMSGASIGKTSWVFRNADNLHYVKRLEGHGNLSRSGLNADEIGPKLSVGDSPPISLDDYKLPHCGVPSWFSPARQVSISITLFIEVPSGDRMEPEGIVIRVE